jgi:hypothetical protein
MSARLIGAALTLLVSGLAVGGDVTDFTGAWTFNAKRSDDAAAKIEEAAGPEYVKGGGKERILPRIGAGDEVDRVRLRQWMLDRIKEFDEVEIEQSPADFKVVDNAENVMIFYFGREHVRQDARGAMLRCRSSWKGPQLVIEQEGDDKTKIIQVFTLLPGGLQMIQALRIESKSLKQPLELRRMYDRLGAEAPARP